MRPSLNKRPIYWPSTVETTRPLSTACSKFASTCPRRLTSVWVFSISASSSARRLPTIPGEEAWMPRNLSPDWNFLTFPVARFIPRAPLSQTILHNQHQLSASHQRNMHVPEHPAYHCQEQLSRSQHLLQELRSQTLLSCHHCL